MSSIPDPQGNIDLPPTSSSEIVKGIVPDRLLVFFEIEHPPQLLRDVSRLFRHLAERVVDLIPAGPERTVALRKLLESKDAAVRAALRPGA